MAELKYDKYILTEPRGEPPPRKTTTAPGVSITEELMSGIGKINCNFNFVGILAPPP